MFSAFFRSLKQEFAGYNSKKLLADMMAGLTVCAVALPLALAFGVSSGASAASGPCHGHHRGRGHRHSRRRVVPDLGPDGRDERGARRHRRGIRPAGRVFCLLCRGRSAAACGHLQAGSPNQLHSDARHHGLHLGHCHHHCDGPDRQLLRHGVGGRLELWKSSRPMAVLASIRTCRRCSSAFSSCW